MNGIHKIATFTTAALCLSILNAVHASPLDLDTSFDGDGKLVTNFDESNNSHDSVRALALQADGKIIAAGSVSDSDNVNGVGSDFGLVRYFPDGAIDTSFGTAGFVTTHVTQDEVLLDVVLQGDGKIVAVGNTDGSSLDLMITRYLPDGSLDSSFGSGGITVIDLGTEELLHSVQLQTDGKIVVAGQSFVTNSASDVLIVRFDQNGLLDSSFGTQGVVITDFNNRWDRALDMDITDDGRITIVGSSWGPNITQVKGILARYHSDGSLDSSLNGGSVFCHITDSCGKVVTDLGGGGTDHGEAIVLRREDETEDGKIVVSGQFGIARYHADGALDNSFGFGGINDASVNTGYDVAIRNDGRIVRVGTGSGGFKIALYSENGELDDSCAGNASVASDFNASQTTARTTLIQPDGKILVGGFARYQDQDFALARYIGGSCNRATLNTDIIKNWAAYNKFVDPLDEVGPIWPGYAQDINGRIQIGQ